MALDNMVDWASYLESNVRSSGERRSATIDLREVPLEEARARNEAQRGVVPPKVRYASIPSDCFLMDGVVYRRGDGEEFSEPVGYYSLGRLVPNFGRMR